MDNRHRAVDDDPNRNAEELRQRIALLKREIAELRRRLRLLSPPPRTATARKRKASDAQIKDAYEEEGGGDYGSVKRTAERLGMSTRQVGRALARMGLGHFRTKFS